MSNSAGLKENGSNGFFLVGKIMVKVVPSPNLDLSSNFASCFSIIFLTTCNPNPVPLPGSLVVKKGQNFLCVASSIPLPLSFTDIEHLSSDFLVISHSFPRHSLHLLHY